VTEPRASRPGGRAASTFSVGLISDTHGLLRPEALRALAGSNFIIHAGDIGDPAILSALRRIAPLTAVRGNNDRGAWAAALPETAVLAIGAVRILVIHDLAELDLDPAATGYRAVVSGHSHRPHCREDNGVLWINPGSAGPRRFRLPIAAGRLRVSGATLTARLIYLV